MHNVTYAWLVVNGFVHTPKFQQLFEWLIVAGRKHNCNLVLKTNTELLPQLPMGSDTLFFQKEKPSFVLFWDKDIRLARLLEKHGLRLFNRAESIEVCDDKARTFLELLDAGIRMPKTVIGPKTFRPSGYEELEFLTAVETQLGYPMVVKECYGSFGQQVTLVENRRDLVDCLHNIQNRPCLFQEYLVSSKGHDIRIQMVGDQLVAAMYRYNDIDFRANITNGGSMEAYNPTPEQVDMARTVMRTLNLDFAGIDLLFGDQQEPVLCEVNSNAHFINLYECTGINTADVILSHCLKEINREA